jgi:hypothetical protein
MKQGAFFFQKHGKAVHGYTKPVEVSIVKRMLVDEISDVIVA